MINNNIGWHALMTDFTLLHSEGNFPLQAYSEFMPPPRVGISPYGEIDYNIFSKNDEYGWHISELEEESELKPGIVHIGEQIMHQIIKLGKGETVNHIAGHQHHNLTNNVYWPDELSKNAGKFVNEKFVVFLPLVFSKTQDDKGRVRWTFFGGSEQGPEKAFWKSFYNSPDNEKDETDSLNYIQNIIKDAFGENFIDNINLNDCGFKVLPTSSCTSLPSWTKQYIIKETDSFENVKYLLTFKPFSELPQQLKEQYLQGKTALLPFPGSLVFWGMPTYNKLKHELPTAQQISLLKLVARHSGNGGVRVPQSGWLHEPHPDIKEKDIHLNLVNNTYHRTHRWQRIHKHEDELLQTPRADKLIKILFSTDLDTIGLYDKPLARNCQLWTNDYKLIIDGPKAKRINILHAETHLAKGGLFGYRFLFPPMQVGLYEVYWHRPLVAYLSSKTNEITIQSESLNGYFTAYNIQDKNINNVIELWPRLLKRKSHLTAIYSLDRKHDHYHHQTAHNIITLIDKFHELGEKKLSREFARHLLQISKHESLDQWLREIAVKATNKADGEFLLKEVEKVIESKEAVNTLPESITFNKTANRKFEESWWNDINFLAHGAFINKDNADCVQDDPTLTNITHKKRDLEPLGDYLLDRHKKAISEAKMEGIALCGETPFKWDTDFSFDAFGGWRMNQEGKTYERNILVIIPGKNRNEAVIMGDHYDTAYMEDVYDKDNGGTGARLSAKGADDNYSASSTLLQAAPIFLEMSKKGLLERDVWLMHITGEEFPSDCLGARFFCRSIIEKTLKLHLGNEKYIDLSSTKIVGAFIMDMIGHNKDTDRDIFQISPGKSVESTKIAYQAHIANLMWNQLAYKLNCNSARSNLNRGKRSTDGITIPEVAKHLPLMGEVRTKLHTHSSLYNTDCQILSDVGIPVVLFMENYDLHRTGYHDTHDTMENIDLDYGAAFAAICIETVARVATQ
ncbi:MAG: M28 family peptidase [Bacteroidia bacterium]|nr:M28 family peptidase [Bacteroidia bacterium]